MRHLAPWAVFCWSLLTLCGIAQAQVENDVRLLLEQQKYKEALELARRTDGSTMPLDFPSALAAIGAGDCNLGMPYYLQHLVSAQNAKYAKSVLDAAYRAVAAAGDGAALECTTKALIAAEEVLSQIAQARTSPRPVRTSGLEGFIQLGVGRDTNVNSKSDEGIDTSTVLLPQAKAIADTFIRAGGGVTLWHRRPTRELYYVSGNYDRADNVHEDAFDRDSFDVQAGVHLPLSSNTFQGRLAYSELAYGHSKYVQSTLLEGGLAVPWKHNASLTPLVTVSRTIYPSPNEQFNNYYYKTGLWFRKNWDGNLQPSWATLASVAKENNTATRPGLSRWEYLLYTALTVNPSRAISILGFGYWQSSDYSPDDISGIDRTDQLRGAGASIEYRLRETGWSVILEASYSSNRSNIDAFSYDRGVATLLMRYSFGK